MPFLCRGLDADPFAGLFDLSDADLRALGVQRSFADEDDAYPCRIALRRAARGDELLLLAYDHLRNAASPYRASGPIFVSRAESGEFRNELPPILRDRLLSLRAYDAAAIMRDADVVESEAGVALIERMFADPAIAHIDVHFARRGCFAVRILRA